MVSVTDYAAGRREYASVSCHCGFSDSHNSCVSAMKPGKARVADVRGLGIVTL